MSQNTSRLLMIRPAAFAFNSETAVNNSFQSATGDANTQEKALAEFDALVELLRSHGMQVTVVNDTREPHTPDSIFPNNWISFHNNGRAYLYPMFAPNRRQERKQTVLDVLREQHNINELVSLVDFEEQGHYLEGTGSMVLDRVARIVYACLSPRTDKQVLDAFCAKEGYRSVVFTARDSAGQPIYHTNVMMCVADKYVVICLESLEEKDKQLVEETINSTGKACIPISIDQMNKFAGNMLQVCNTQGQKFLVMSSSAYHSLTEEQKTLLTAYNPILHSPLPTIETNGGGSARCMIAEIF